MELVFNIIKGVMIGIANVIPGVSGGTMAVSFGIYDRLISSISGFTKHVNEGDKIKKGTPIVSFDIDKIKAAGYDTTVSVIISNTADFAEVTGVPAEKADLTRVVIKAVK